MPNLEEIFADLPDKNSAQNSLEDIFSELPDRQTSKANVVPAGNWGAQSYDSALAFDTTDSVANTQNSTPAANDGLFAKSLKYGLGRLLSDDDKALIMAGKPAHISDEEWLANIPEWRKSIHNYGEQLKKENEVKTEPWTADWAIQGVGQMAPEMVGLAGASMAAMRGSPNALQARMNAYNAAIRGGLGNKAATLAGELAASGAIAPAQAIPEAEIEANDAYNEAVKNGRSQQEAQNIRDYVRKTNIALLSGSDAVQNVLALGKIPLPAGTASRLAAKAGRLGLNAGFEGGEEGFQEAIPSWATGEAVDSERVKQAAALGAIGGGVFHAAGRGISNLEDIFSSLPDKGNTESQVQQQSQSRPQDFNSQLQNFKAAITDIESGGDYGAVGPEIDGDRARGKYQIMESNWPSWAENAGLPADAPMTPENQERVVDAKMQEYYKQFGDWGKVAIAWHAGPGRADFSDEQLAKLSDGNMSTLDYRNSVVGKMGNIAPGLTSSLSSMQNAQNQYIETPLPTFTPEEQQQVVTWLEERRDTSDNEKEINDIDKQLTEKKPLEILTDYKVKDENGQEVALGQKLFPEKYQQQQIQAPAQPNAEMSPFEQDYIKQVIQQEIKNSKDQEWKKYLSGIAKGNVAALTDFANNYSVSGTKLIDLSKQAALNQSQQNFNRIQQSVNNAKIGLQNLKTSPVQPFIGSEQESKGRDLAATLNAIATQKYDQAVQGVASVPSRTEPIKTQTVNSSPETLSRLNQLTGQQTEQILMPTEPNQAGQQAIQELRQQVMPSQPIPISTAEEKIMKRGIMQAIGRKDYPTAISLAKQLGTDKHVAMYENAMMARGANAVKEHLTSEDIKRSAAYDKLDEFEKLVVDVLEHYGVSADSVESELHAEYNRRISEYIKVLRGQMKQGTVKSTGQNASGDLFTRNHSMNYQWYRDMLNRNGGRIPSKVALEQGLKDAAIDHLKSGYSDSTYGPQVSEEDVEYFNDLEAAIDGIRQVKNKIRPAVREELRKSEPGGAVNHDNIQEAARNVIPFGRKLGTNQERVGGGSVRETSAVYVPSQVKFSQSKAQGEKSEEASQNQRGNLSDDERVVWTKSGRAYEGSLGEKTYLIGKDGNEYTIFDHNWNSIDTYSPLRSLDEAKAYTEALLKREYSKDMERQNIETRKPSETELAAVRKQMNININPAVEYKKLKSAGFSYGENYSTPDGEYILQADSDYVKDFKAGYADAVRGINAGNSTGKGYYNGRIYSLIERGEIPSSWHSAKYSAGQNTPPDSAIEQALEIRLVPDAKLKPNEIALSELGSQMGVPVRFFVGKREFRGFHIDGITYINRNGDRGIEWAFWHEGLHWMKQQDPALYQDLYNAINDTFAVTPEQITAYRTTIKQGELRSKNGEYLLSDDDIIEEMFGDEMADVAKRQKWLSQLAQQDRGLFDRFVDFLKEILADIKAKIVGNQVGQRSGFSPEQVREVEKSLRNVLLSLKDAAGQRAMQDRTKFPYRELPAQAMQYSANKEQNKKPSVLIEGFRTESGVDIQQATPDEFIVKPDGTKDFGEITPKEASQMRRQAGKIRLQVGQQRRGNSYGLIHTKTTHEAQILQQGYKDVEHFIEDVVANFTEIRQGNGSALMLIKKSSPNMVAVVELVPEREGGADFYTVKTALPANEDYVEKFKPLLDRSATLSPRPDSGAALGENPRNVGEDLHSASNRSGSESNARFQSGGLQLPKEGITKHDSIDSIVQQEKKDVNKGTIKYSAESEASENSVQSATDNLAHTLGLKPAENVTVVGRTVVNEPGFAGRYLQSVKPLAEKHPKLMPFFRLASTAMEKQEKLRNDFRHRLNKIEKLLGNKENKKSLFKILLDGDASQHNYTTQELTDAGYNGNVIRAYHAIRTAYQHAYKLANEIRQGIETKSENMSAAKLAELKINKFVEILSVAEKGRDQYLVSWKQPKITEHVVTVTKSELEALRQDPNVQITKERLDTGTTHAMPESSGLTRGDDWYEVEYRSQTPPIANREGYIPHFFHDWFVMAKTDEGADMLYSARTMREAVQYANKYVKANPDAEILIKPKQFRFPGADVNAAIMGDMNYFKLSQKVSDDLEISLDDAKEWLDGKVHMKNRHRFVGNFLQRKGANGWEKDLDWVNQHYFNMVSRYVAMDPFKSKSISTFERLFGQYDKEYQGLANYVKDYINDVNGVPTEIENAINNSLNGNKYFNKWLGAFFGDRPALQLVTNITNAVAVLKLGMLNVSSGMLQLTQFINVASAMDSYKHARQGLAASFAPSLADRRILAAANVDANLSMETVGYSKAGQMGKAFQWSTIIFRYGDLLMRRTAVLGAYRKAVEQGKSRGQAIEYAKDINRKANFEYGVNDAPNIFRRGGPVSQVLLQFKKYPIKQMELMIDLAKHGDIGQNAKFWVPYMLLSGIWGIPLLSVFKEVFGWFGWDWDDEAKKAMFEWAGKDEYRQALVKTAWYGLLSNTAYGIDVSKRTGIGDAVPTSIKDMAGPVIGTIYQTAKEISRGNGFEAAKAVSPGIGNILVAAAGEIHGDRGRVKTKYEEMYERAQKVLGFMPVSENMANDRDWVEKNMKRKIRDEVADAIDDYLEAEADKDSNAKQKAMKELQRLKVSPRQVANERMQKQRTNLQRTEKSIPKKYRNEFRDIQQFE